MNGEYLEHKSYTRFPTIIMSYKQPKPRRLHISCEEVYTIRVINMKGFCFEDYSHKIDLRCQNSFSQSIRFTWIFMFLLVTKGAILTQ